MFRISTTHLVLALALATPAPALSTTAGAEHPGSATSPLFERASEIPLVAGNIAITDLNLDGHPDLAVVGAAISILWSDGAGHYTVTTVSFDAARGVAAGDLNHDGFPDLAISLDGPGGIAVLLNDGRENFGPPVHYPTSNCCGDRVWLRDLDRDGHLDAIVVNTDDHFFSVLLGDGDGGFAPQIALQLEGYSDWVAVADFDRDGHLDLVASNSFEPRVRWFRGESAGGFTPAGDFTIARAWVGALAAGDLNEDGWPDLAAGQFTPEGGVTTLLFNDRNGGFTRVDLDPAVGPLRALADLDRNGTLDLVTATSTPVSTGPDLLSVLLGNGDGTFTKENDYAIPPGLRAIAVGDLDSNGMPDLAVAAASIARLLNRAPAPNLVDNPSFESPAWNGWDPYGGSRVDRSDVARTGRYGLRVRGTNGGAQFGVNDHPNWAQGLEPGSSVRFRAWVRGPGAPGPARMRVREYVNKVRVGGSNYSNVVVLGDHWQALALDYRVRRPGASLDLQIIVDPAASRATFYVDDVSIEVLTDESAAPPAATAAAEHVETVPGAAFTTRVTPNPARGEVVLEIETPRPGLLRAGLFDLAGRRVRTLVDEPSARAGRHDVRVGPALSPGVYYFRVEAGERRASGRIVILE